MCTIILRESASPNQKSCEGAGVPVAVRGRVLREINRTVDGTVNRPRSYRSRLVNSTSLRAVENHQLYTSTRNNIQRRRDVLHRLVYRST